MQLIRSDKQIKPEMNELANEISESKNLNGAVRFADKFAYYFLEKSTFKYLPSLFDLADMVLSRSELKSDYDSEVNADFLFNLSYSFHNDRDLARILPNIRKAMQFRIPAESGTFISADDARQALKFFRDAYSKSRNTKEFAKRLNIHHLGRFIARVFLHFDNNIPPSEIELINKYTAKSILSA
ncbi:hypothetical protein AGMMS49975_27310 [Clostridia bacterium]|nr:hypothetical protein AGMMS49975_27310 [Clostridia bacterium]